MSIPLTSFTIFLILRTDTVNTMQVINWSKTSVSYKGFKAGTLKKYSKDIDSGTDALTKTPNQEIIRYFSAWFLTSYFFCI